MNNLGNKPVIAANIKRYMQIKGINAKQLSRAINVPYTTVLSWLKAEYYPRIDKIEMMSEYFGVLKSDLIEDKQKQPIKDELSTVQKELLNYVRNMSEEQAEGLLALLKGTFGK